MPSFVHPRRRNFLATLPGLALSSKGLNGADMGPVQRLEESFRRLAKQHGVTHAVLRIRLGKITQTWTAGLANPETPFLLASITKPMTAIAVMQLVEQGLVRLADPLQKYVPEFRGDGREGVTLKHLLTHTSGLPDMLPENDAMRKRHAPLSEFVAAACKTPLLFRPGTECRYQSMGILLASAVVERLTKQALPVYLQKKVFEPLGMRSTTLGLGGRNLSDTAPSMVTADPGWNWNSAYWRNLGAPWGGAIGTAQDITLLLEAFAKPTGKVLRPETARQMVCGPKRETEPVLGDWVRGERAAQARAIWRRQHAGGFWPWRFNRHPVLVRPNQRPDTCPFDYETRSRKRPVMLQVLSDQASRLP